MNINSEIKSIIDNLGIPVETGVFSGTAPDTYVVLVPVMDTFEMNADDTPQYDVQELRITLYSKDNYLKLKKQITDKVLENGFYVTERRYGGYDSSTGYHQYTIDVEKQYDPKEDN